jgi:hypothetical protein
LNTIKPDIDLLLPAHNVPVASPDMLTELSRAIHAIQKGTAKSVKQDGFLEYRFQGFSILLGASTDK